MSVKLVKRILLAGIAVLAFWMAAQRYTEAAGLTTETALLGAFGGLALFLAVTGKG